MKIPHVVLSFVAAGAVTLIGAGCFSDATPASTTGDPTPNGSGGATTGGGTGATTGGGTASTTGGGTTSPPGDAVDVIDDMEGATGSILAKDGRVGAWYVYNDGTAGATETPGVPFLPTAISPPRGTSTYAAKMKGEGFTTWGAGMGLNFNDPGNGDGGSAKASYDASKFDGLTFWAKIGAGSTAAVRVNVSTKETDPAGGTCTPVAKCSDHFGKNINLTAEWVQYTIKFADLTQLGWGQSVPKFNASAVYAAQFQVAKATTFDIWVDDIAFHVK